MADQGIVVYDGDCGVCEASARWIERNIADIDVMSHYEYGVEELGSVWFIDAQKNYEGANAVAHILMLSSSLPIRLAGRALTWPVVRVVASGVYRLIAHNRRHISRLLGMKACAVPPAKN